MRPRNIVDRRGASDGTASAVGDPAPKNVMIQDDETQLMDSLTPMKETRAVEPETAVGMSRLESEMDSESKLMESQLVSQDEESKLMEETLFHGFSNHMSFGDSDGGTCDKYSCDDDSFCGESFGDKNVLFLSVDLRDMAATVPCDADDLCVAELGLVDVLCLAERGLPCWCPDVGGRDHQSSLDVSFGSPIDHCDGDPTNLMDACIIIDWSDGLSVIDNIYGDDNSTVNNQKVFDGPNNHGKRFDGPDNNGNGVDGSGKGSMCSNGCELDLFKCSQALGRGALSCGACVLGPTCGRRVTTVSLLGTHPVVKVKRYKDNCISSQTSFLDVHDVVNMCWEVATHVLVGLTPHIMQQSVRDEHLCCDSQQYSQFHCFVLVLLFLAGRSRDPLYHGSTYTVEAEWEPGEL